jgi:polyisoprenyl-teichoic acid--peptidoglycan teichoic acid transferase
MTVTNSSRIRLVLCAVVLVAIGCASPTATPTPSATATGRPGGTATATIPAGGNGPSNGPTDTSGPPVPGGSSPSSTPAGSSTPAASSSPTARPPIAGLDQLTGSDGRLTVLLLGSDARPGLIGRRTDAIMVVSIDPTSGKVTAVSLPRDVQGIPTGPGHVYPVQVTGLYQSYLLAGATEDAAARKTQAALGYAFGTEIDHYLFIGFTGVPKLVDAVGGVNVTLAKPLDDNFLQIRPGVHGFHLKKGVNHLNGDQALLFARTRHADSDYARDARQQLLIIACLKAVLARGAGFLPTLVDLINGGAFQTDVPLTEAPALFELLQRADLKTVRSAVLGPRKFAAAGAARYSTIMRVAAVRALFDAWLKPIPQP